eukprot:CAMPEP_0113695070 /NCGR_PEP_ID=MMETSP0038_2-20120614/20672_1 /TAXON_ID=2898 /ORGANISM="Cryptomonas paramecium" /LENGTH=60 /DNA_ID=CAMNT_0000617525 /DNA_START=1 /DNA_END=179 /DNA_ORIENTATION=+ /assembly_acc=CAM_ASM_000170
MPSGHDSLIAEDSISQTLASFHLGSPVDNTTSSCMQISDGVISRQYPSCVSWHMLAPNIG